MKEFNLLKNIPKTSISFVCIIFGIFLGNQFRLNDQVVSVNQNISADDLGLIRTVNLFLKIFLTNLTLLLVTIYIGFFTGGLLTLVILIFNSINLTFVANEAKLVMSNTDLLVKFLFHGLLEVYTFLVAANISFGGWQYYRRAVENDCFDKDLLPRNKYTYILIGFVFVSAFLEVININYL
ncbi:stage II sporulation protein M [Sphingobacterium deserti]|uniref:Stage II sporulation protein M n=1 Tax=Sphingobacterium deserti TaxID=1229276 RepID=A0A0B8T890_9SPHI|nr:stage II sporulation protein M [Sphingobacterium deserti]KGE14874.1 hypothetical protein DI53_1374 [Sphingobacterium deserti]